MVLFDERRTSVPTHKGRIVMFAMVREVWDIERKSGGVVKGAPTRMRVPRVIWWIAGATG
jgi:hypothetical protein